MSSADIDIVGCNDGKNGRNCFCHEICGKHITVDNVVVFRWEVIPINNKPEETIKAYLIKDGTQLCHIGFLPRKLLKDKEKYMNKMAIIVEDLRESDDPNDRRNSFRNMGVLKSRMLEDIEEQFRQ
jgi:hypothetical protein